MATSTQQSSVSKECISVKSLGISTDKPKFSQYAVLTKRVESFEEQDWPTNYPVKVDDLVEAGLVYTGVGGSVRCYYCGGGLRNWDKGDDPMLEHARWYPTCPHILLVKGHKFVKQVLDGQVPEEQSPDETAQLEDTDVFQSPSTVALLEVGYSEEDVRKALAVFIRRHGNTEYNAEQLCEILLEMEEGIDDSEQRAASSGEVEVNTVDSTIDDQELESLKEENQRLKDDHLCKICLERKGDIVFLPCSHMMCCGQCAPAVKKCPICRKMVSGLFKSFMMDFRYLSSPDGIDATFTGQR